MVLTNAERQARYRERLKRIVAEAKNMSPVMADLVLKTRIDLRVWKSQIARYETGQMRMYNERVDRSLEQLTLLRRMVAENGALVEKYDPDGGLTDGNVELGNIPAGLATQMTKARPVSYALDSDGRACDLRLFPTVEMARTDAAASAGRRYGLIGQDLWSIAALEPDE